MFSIRQVLPTAPRFKVIDVGAMSLGAGTEPYARLAASFPCDILGFEPIAEECERLNASAPPGCRYLPHAVGDGSRQEFRQCSAPMTSSLFEPDLGLLGMFHGLADLTRVVSRTPVQTVRLDDIPEAAGTDYLKLDVQGAELMVLEGARRLLEDVLVVHSEVEFLPMYRDQPLFADIDAHLRARGFLLHRIHGIHGETFRLPGVEVSVGEVVNQQLWAEVLYVRDFRRLDGLPAEALLKYAAILHENYGSSDLATLVLAAYDRQTGTDLADHLLQLVFEDQAAGG